MGSKSRKTGSTGVGAFVVVLIIVACIYGWFTDDSETEDAGDLNNATQSSEQPSSDSFADPTSDVGTTPTVCRAAAEGSAPITTDISRTYTAAEVIG